MQMRRAAVVLGAVATLSAVGSASASGDAEKKERRRGLFGAIGKMIGNEENKVEDGAILAEDEGYWERFLQQTADSLPTAMPTNPPTNLEFCQTTVNVACVDSNENDCRGSPEPTDPADCLEDFTYTYTVNNVGSSCMDLNSWTATYAIAPEGVASVINLLPSVPVNERQVCPGESMFVTRVISTDLCLGNTYDMDTQVRAAPPNGIGCEAVDEYVVEPPATCGVGITIDCVGDDGTPCDAIPVSPDRCVQDLLYTFCPINTGSTCIDVEDFTRTLRPPPLGSARDILPLLVTQFGSTRICPNDTPPNTCVQEQIRTNLCTSVTYETEASISGRPPNGSSCDSTAQSRVIRTTAPPTAAPTPDATICNVEVNTECSTQAATVNDSGECDALVPIITRCDQRATFMEMLFNGGGCDQSFNIQGADKFDCTDANGGPALEGTYFVHAYPTGGGDTYFSGPVAVGDVFPLCPGYPACSGDQFEADSTFRVFAAPVSDPVNDDSFVQAVNFHTSCSQNLFLKDKYGSSQLVIFFNGLQGLVSCFVTATFSISLTNQGFVNAERIVLFTNSVNGNVTDLTNAVQGVIAGDVIVVTTQILVDMTIRQSYFVQTDIVGISSSGAECTDSSSFTFAAGNDLDAPPGIIDPSSF
jgi:hypothetical protein